MADNQHQQKREQQQQNKQKQESSSGRVRETGFEEYGGYMSAKRAKLDDQFHAARPSSISSSLFSGVRVFVNGHTEPPASEIRRLMLVHGGVFQHTYRHRGAQRTTHVVASMLSGASLRRDRHKLVVRPDWLTESVSAGRLLDCHNFLLNNPPGDGEGEEDSSGDEVLTDQEELVPGSQCADVLDDCSSRGGQSSPIKQAGDPGFLQQYFSKSRLHHISEMKVEMSELVASLQKTEDVDYSGRADLIRWCNREDGGPSSGVSQRGLVAHIDLDCFFVSVSLLSRPHLVGQPVVVTHSRSLSSSSSMAEVACCSYEARAVGVRNGMLLGDALKLCPGLHAVPYEFAAYRKASRAMYLFVASLSRHIQAVSCDELLLNCDELLADKGVSPGQLAGFLRQEIETVTGGCPVSVGIGCSVLVARLATAAAKPAGQMVVSGEEEDGFVARQPLGRLPGLGRAAARALTQLGCITCGDLRRLSVHQLSEAVGGSKLGRRLFEACRARDSASVTPNTRRRSVSVDVNYGIRFSDRERLFAFVGEVCDELWRRVSEAGFVGSRITLRLMVRSADAPRSSAKFMGHGRCDTVSRSSAVTPDSLPGALLPAACRLYDSIGVCVQDVRGISLQLSVAPSERSPSKLPAVKSLSIVNLFRRARTANPGVTSSTSSTSFSSSMSLEAALDCLGGVSALRHEDCAQCEKPREPPLFFGCREPGQVASLLGEWLESGVSGDPPQTSDCSAVLSYLSQLVNAWMLASLSGLLKLMSRRAGLLQLSEAWMQQVEGITAAVQQRVERMYGAPLDLH